MKNYIAFILLLSVGLVSCESTTDPLKGITDKGDRIFILNQGNFMHIDASLDVYNWTTSTLSNNLINPLGDVGNDLQYINGKLYTVLDNSAKIEVINPDSPLVHHSISFPTGSAPWKILAISATEALVSENYTGEMAVVNLTTDAITKTISIGSGQNSLVLIGGNVFATTGSNELVKIDPVLKTVTAQKYIGDSPQQIIVDTARGMLVIRTEGNYFPKTAGKLLFVNPSTMAIVDSIVLDTTTYLNQVVPAGNKAYLLFTNGVKVIDLATHTISTDAIFTKPYYGGYFDASKNLLYLGTAVDFTHNDVVDIFDISTHSLKKTINCGIAPAFFAVVR